MSMKINLAKSAGFCFGVKRALDIAFRTISSRSDVYMMGDIVHNEDVIEEIEKAGIKKIIKLKSVKNKRLLIRAHGVGMDLLAKARKLGYNIVDATCPMVKEIHGIAKKMENKGYRIIIIGNKDHDEVQGIIGQLKAKPMVIENLNDVAFNKIKKAAVVVQSTQNIEKVARIAEKLKLRVNELRFFNTICKPTRLKQEEIRKMPLENDVMIIAGSKTSANTKRLYEIAKAINKKSYWVQSRRDIKPAWFKGARNIGVTAGASTPDRTIKEIIEYLQTTK